MNHYTARNHLKSLLANYTSVQAVDPFVTISNGRAYFRIEDLMALFIAYGEEAMNSISECFASGLAWRKEKYAACVNFILPHFRPLLNDANSEDTIPNYP